MLVGPITTFMCIGSTLLVGSQEQNGLITYFIIKEKNLVGEIPNLQQREIGYFSLDKAKKEILYLSQINQTKIIMERRQHLTEKKVKFANLKSKKIAITEQTFIDFKFPRVVIVKGGWEVIFINITTNHFSYLKLPNCAVAVSRNKGANFGFTALVDEGPSMFSKVFVTMK